MGFQKKLLRLETAPECKTVQLQVSTKAACLSALENTQLRQMSNLEVFCVYVAKDPVLLVYNVRVGG